MSEEAEPLNEIKEGLARRLRGFAPAPGDEDGFAMVLGGRGYHRFEVDPARLPLPGLVQLALDLLGCTNLGRAEKLAWEYPFTVDGVGCSLASQKFGLRLYISDEQVPEDADARALAERIQKRLDIAQRFLERDLLRAIAEDQIRQGRVTIRNQYGRLRGVYDYFRDGAELAFAGQGRLGPEHPGGGFWIAPKQTEGFYNTVAMVSAYFSALEHATVLMLPFMGFDPSSTSIKTFIGDRWGTKFTALFDISAAPSRRVTTTPYTGSRRSTGTPTATAGSTSRVLPSASTCPASARYQPC